VIHAAFTFITGMADVDEDDFLYGDSAQTTAFSATAQKRVDKEMNQASEGEVDEFEEEDSDSVCCKRLRQLTQRTLSLSLKQSQGNEQPRRRKPHCGLHANSSSAQPFASRMISQNRVTATPEKEKSVPTTTHQLKAGMAPRQ
jgi:hypothetical protein